MALIICVCVCMYAASALQQLVWECSVCPFSCLMKHNKTLFQLKGGLEYAFPSMSFHWQVCQQQQQRGRDANSGMPGVVFPKRPSWKYETNKKQWKKLCYAYVCLLPSPWRDRTFHKTGLRGSWKNLTYSTINSKGSQLWVFHLQHTAMKRLSPRFLAWLSCLKSFFFI